MIRNGPIFIKSMQDGRKEVTFLRRSSCRCGVEPDFVEFYPVLYCGDFDSIETWVAAINGDPNSRNYIGLLLSRLPHITGDTTISADYRTAINWFELAASAGSLSAKCNLGIIHLRGLGVIKDDKIAFRLFKESSESLHQTPVSYLADCYENGIGTDCDISMAEYLWELANEVSQSDGY